MSEPKRWIDEGPPEAVGHLLEAASAERPPEVSLSRALTALGLGVGATGAATTAGAATAGVTTAGTTAASATAAGAVGVVSAGKATTAVVAGALVKWVLVGGALVAASVGGTAVVKRAMVHDASERAQVTLAAHGATTTPGVTAPGKVTASPNAGGTLPNGVETSPNGTETSPNTLETSPNGADGASALPSLAQNVAIPSSAASHASVRAAHKSVAPSVAAASEEAAPIDAERLAEEVALVDRARSALARGDAQATLGALDDYDARFSPRKFAPEALYLRMEALLRLGQTSAARAAAEHLATKYPSSPNAARARQVLGESIP